MLWLNYLRQSGEAYADLKQYLETRKSAVLSEFTAAKDMDAVNKLKGKVDGLVELQLIVTQEERAEHERAIRADANTRAQRGEYKSH